MRLPVRRHRKGSPERVWGTETPSGLIRHLATHMRKIHPLPGYVRRLATPKPTRYGRPP